MQLRPMLETTPLARSRYEHFLRQPKAGSGPSNRLGDQPVARTRQPVSTIITSALLADCRRHPRCILTPAAAEARPSTASSTGASGRREGEMADILQKETGPLFRCQYKQTTFLREDRRHVPSCRPPPLFSGLRESPDLTATTRHANLVPCPSSAPIKIRENGHSRRRWSRLESRPLSPARARRPRDRRHPRLPYARAQGSR